MANNKSNLPEGVFTSTSGSNWNLDGFLFDGEGTGEGVMQGGRLPSAQGFSGLPGNNLSEHGKFDNAPYGPRTVRAEEDPGITNWFSEEDGLDLRSFLAADIHESRLPNLDWLELQTDLEKQDPNRLPRDPSNLSIEELSQAWGIDRRTHGIRSEGSKMRLEGSNVDLDHARYFTDPDKEAPRPQRFSMRQIQAVVQAAARRSAAGDPIRNILIETAQVLGEDSNRVASAMKSIIEEHGLAGKVFLRASVYPGCEQGTWNNQVPQSAQYVVASSKCVGCVYNQNSACGIFQRRLVASVPWEHAYLYYVPRLASLGVKIATQGDPKEVLRQAFATPGHIETPERDFPVDHSHKYFRIDELMREAKADEAVIAVTALRAREGDQMARKVATYLGQCVRAGYLTKEQAIALGQSGHHLAGIQDMVSLYISKQQSKKGQFEGDVFRGHAGEQSVPQLDPWQQELKRVAGVAGVKVAEVTNMLQRLRLHLNDGWAGNRLDGLMRSEFGTNILTASTHLTHAMRTQHEGLAGHLYIEAAAYGESGIQGCETGAQHHSKSSAPYVLAMDKCSGCVFRNMHNTCTKYNRPLAGGFPENEKQAFQAQTITASNMEYTADNMPTRTASNYAPVVDPAAEFGLVNGTLNNFSLYSESPDTEEFDIQFGDGFILL